MDIVEHHNELMKGITSEFKTILEKSGQAVYIYLDDTHRVCNEKLVSLLGYRTPEEWARTDGPWADIDERSRDETIALYKRVVSELISSSLDVTFRNVKTGEPVRVNMIIVPVGYGEHVFAMHFLRKI